MWYLIFILITLAFLAGFLALANREAHSGVRLYADYRSRFDKDVERIEFILAHIDLGAFLHGEIRHLASRIGHNVVHFSLLAVRAVERLLTRVIRHQHAKKEVDAIPVESAREYVKTLSEFKEQLDATHPEVRDIRE